MKHFYQEPFIPRMKGFFLAWDNTRQNPQAPSLDNGESMSDAYLSIHCQ